MVASGRYHRSVRSVDLARFQVSFLRFLLRRTWDPHITVAFGFLLLDLTRAAESCPSPCRRQVAAAAHPRQHRRSLARSRAPCAGHTRHRASLARARPALSPPRRTKPSPLPSLTARLQSSCWSSSAVCPSPTSLILVRPDQCSKFDLPVNLDQLHCSDSKSHSGFST